MGFFGSSHGWPSPSVRPPLQKKPPPPLLNLSHNPAMMKLGTVIPDLTMIKEIYESRDTPLEFC